MQCVYEFLSINFKAHKFASSQTNDINVSILGLYFLGQCLNQEKNLHNLLRFPSSVQETKTSKFSSRVVVQGHLTDLFGKYLFGRPLIPYNFHHELS